jgi:hypothetical protein
MSFTRQFYLELSEKLPIIFACQATMGENSRDDKHEGKIFIQAMLKEW